MFLPIRDQKVRNSKGGLTSIEPFGVAPSHERINALSCSGMVDMKTHASRPIGNNTLPLRSVEEFMHHLVQSLRHQQLLWVGLLRLRLGHRPPRRYPHRHQRRRLWKDAAIVRSRQRSDAARVTLRYVQIAVSSHIIARQLVQHLGTILLCLQFQSSCPARTRWTKSNPDRPRA